MTPPPVILHVSWWEAFRDRVQERRYRNVQRAARQVLAILSAPDEIVQLRELAQTVGWEKDALSWRSLDPREFVVEALDGVRLSEVEADDEMTVTEQYELIRQAWIDAQERPRAGAGDLHAHAGSVTGTDETRGATRERPRQQASPLGAPSVEQRGE